MEEWGTVLLQLGIILAGLAALSWLAGKLSISPIPLYLVAGLAFGAEGFIPVYATESFVNTGGAIGLVLLLLVLGLEFSALEFVAGLRKHSSSGLVDFLLNFSPGLIMGFILGFGWQGALALGGVTWISSSGIISQVLEDLGRVANRETASVMSILVIEDIAMAIFLPVLVVLLTGGSLFVGVGRVILAIGVLVVAGFIAIKGGDRINRIFGHESNDQVVLRILGVTFIAAGLAEGVGIGSAVGAFLVGLAIPPELGERARELLLPLRTVFAAVYFFSFGIDVDASALSSSWLIAAILALVTTFTKVGTGWFAAGRDKIGNKGRLRAGLTLVPRGEFSIVIAAIGASAGIPGISALATAYVLIMAFLGPILARQSDWFAGFLPKKKKKDVPTQPGTNPVTPG